MNNSEQLTDDVVTAIVGGAWTISGAIVAVGGIIGSIGLLVCNATLQVAIPWWLIVLSSFPIFGGAYSMVLGGKQIRTIYERRLRNSKYGL